MKNNVLKDRSFELAVEIILVYRHLTHEKQEFIMSRQVLRSGTSVGANISEGVSAQTKKEFCYRLALAYREARETEFWLRLLCTAGYMTFERANQAMGKCDEVIRLLFAILRTADNKAE